MSRNFSDAPPTLPPLLDEFRTALQDEIEVAKRSASNSAIPLNNGHKIADLGSAYQYAFLIDSILNTPDGAPGDLIVPGKDRMEATIVSVEGLRIVISVETDLGKFVAVARLQTNLTILMRRLIQRIEDNASAQNPAAERMLGNAPVIGTQAKLNCSPKLNESQCRALECALGRNLTVIWGPPGTGKTYTIGTITEYLYKNSRSVLLVSHTNTAVDQAIKHVARSMKEQLPEGVVIRVGEVRDEVLRSDYPDVLLKTQVKRRSRELVEQREQYINQRQLLSDEMSAAQKSIAIIEWLESANQEIDLVETTIRDLENLRQEEQKATIKFAALREQHSSLLELHRRTARALELRKLLLSMEDKRSSMQREIKAISEVREQVAKKIAEQDSRTKIALRIEHLRKEQSTYPTLIEQKAIISNLSGQITELKEVLAVAQNKLGKANALLSETQSVGTIARVFRHLPKSAEQQTVVNSLSGKITTLDAEIRATQGAHNAVTAKLARIIEINSELSRYENIGSYPQELKLRVEAEQSRDQIAVKTNELDEAWSKLQSYIRQIGNEQEQLSQTFKGDAKDVYLEVCSELQKYNELQKSIESFNDRATRLKNEVKIRLSRLVSTTNQWKGLAETPSSPSECLDMIRVAHADISLEYKSVDLKYLLEKVSSLRAEIQKLNSQITEIDAKLTLVEHEVISSAAVVGATLTKTYLSDDIQGRKFDTVILDEASMAPIPALWVAALLADKNLIIVGDFKQLPPIVLSSNELTKKWLGRDIFEVSRLKEKWEKGDSPSHFVPLVEQRRMLPEIAQVANLFYGTLKNAFTVPEQYDGFDSFTEWYVKEWPHDNPIVLVDTGSLHAWVTSVVKNGHSSRLNFLSATIAVDLAEQLLSPDRQKHGVDAPKRVLIVAPYRSHAKLVGVLLKDFSNLQDEVVAGTAHSFQGSEADVVIFDMVVDEPHFRVNLFMPSLDEELKCLLNVALTRAKFRLFILGNFEYCGKQGKKAFLGSTLIPFLLQRFPRIDAKHIVPDGLAARAAKAQMSTLGGEIDPDTDRIVVTQDDFYHLLLSDIMKAQDSVIIYSPFITLDRLAFLLPQFQGAIERGVQIYIITKALSERSNTELSTIRKIEKQLSEINAIIIHKLRMHEKLVFIDEDITWSGSLNPLSFSNTQEIMERRKSKTVLRDYFQILRLQELLAIQGAPESKCPICSAEMIAVEGRDEPYYWSCTNEKCYTRSIDQPYPFEGVLTCGNCNSSVEYGFWGDYPHWRCTANSKHRQKIFKSHLRLPKMAALVPKNERKKLCRLLQIDNFDDYILSSKSGLKTQPEQMNLFD
jgi:hypothetical protein